MITRRTFATASLVLVPLSLAAGMLHWGETVVFVCSGLAILPLAIWLSTATEKLSVALGPSLGALLNAVFLDRIDQDAQRLERVNLLLDGRARSGLRPIELLVLRRHLVLVVLLLGARLLALARAIAFDSLTATGGIGMVVDAAGEELIDNYRRYGFRRVSDQSMRLFLPTRSLVDTQG